MKNIKIGDVVKCLWCNEPFRIMHILIDTCDQVVIECPHCKGQKWLLEYRKYGDKINKTLKEQA